MCIFSGPVEQAVKWKHDCKKAGSTLEREIWSPFKWISTESFRENETSALRVRHNTVWGDYFSFSGVELLFLWCQCLPDTRCIVRVLNISAAYTLLSIIHWNSQNLFSVLLPCLSLNIGSSWLMFKILYLSRLHCSKGRLKVCNMKINAGIAPVPGI